MHANYTIQKRLLKASVSERPLLLALAESPGLTGSENKMLGTLALHCDWRTYEVDLLWQTIADETGLSLRAVANAQAGLIRKGKITVTNTRRGKAGRWQGANHYRILWPCLHAEIAA